MVRHVTESKQGGKQMNRCGRACAVVVVVAAAGALVPARAAVAAESYTVEVTCKVPRLQPERQLAPDHCLNYIPDGTQTYTATVTDNHGRAVSGVWVHWSDNSDAAKFRVRKNPCKTASNGSCSDELVVRNPKRGMKITVTATVGGSSDVGYLSFS
jgi:hypothetical protein